jgi:hypothetical protein
MRRVQLPEAFLRASQNPSVTYAFHRAFLPDDFVSTATNSSPRAVLELFFTQRHLACLKIPADEWDRYRLVQHIIPAICVFRWAACLDAAGGPDSHIEHIDKHFNAFLELNRVTLFGDWPPEPVLDALMPTAWYQQLEEWRAAIEAREGGLWTRSFPDLLERPPAVVWLAMSPSGEAAYPAPVWRQGRCRLVQSVEDEDLARANGWRSYGEPAVEQKAAPILSPSPGGSSLPRLSAWEDLSIEFTYERMVKVVIAAEKPIYKGFEEIGFADERTGKARRAWTMLHIFAAMKGEVRRSPDHTMKMKWKDIEKRVQEINQILRQQFHMGARPVCFVRNVGYRTRFKISAGPNARL